MPYLKKLKIQLVKGEFTNRIKGQVRDPEQVYEVFKSIKDWAQETLIGVYMSETLEVRTYDVLSIGGKDMTLVLPHEIFEHIIITKSRAFILIHNHPSGNATPSFKDREIMQTLKEQSGVMKIKFVDFIIVGEGCYWSMVKEGLEEYVKEAAA